MIRPATLVIPWRTTTLGAERSGEVEVFILERPPRARFHGGAWSFPGGRMAAGDERPGLDLRDDSTEAERAARACALRHLLTDAGVLPAGAAVEIDLAELRRRVTDAPQPVQTLTSALGTPGARDAAAALVPAGHRVTPTHSARRFDTRLFLVQVAASDGSEDDGGNDEDRGRWIRPHAALQEWRRSGLQLDPLAFEIVEVLDHEPPAEAARTLAAGPAEFAGSGGSIVYAPGYALIPLTTPPLPPSIPTSAFIIGGDEFILVDPGPPRAAEREHLLAAVKRELDRGRRVRAVVLTHHHPDHVGSLAEALELCDAPLWAHSRTGELIDRELDRELHEGDEIELGVSPDGTPDWKLEVLFTPGHAQGHIALWDPRHGSLLAGDLISTIVSMYVGSPGGSLRDYFHSLERIRQLAAARLYPSHGTPTDDVEKLIRRTVAHRLRRIDETLAVLDDEPRSALELALAIYVDAPKSIRPLVEQTTRAVLRYLEEEGSAREVGDDRFARVR